MSNGEQQGEITVKMILSGEDLKEVIGGLPAGASVAVSQTPTLINVEKGIRTSPTFLSIFKPLVALEAVKTGIKGLLQHSSIMNTYLGAMGKMFGAAVDLLLLPFTPLLNLIMMAMGKLLVWLITSGLLEKISQGVDTVIKCLADWGNDIKAIWKAIRDFNLGDIITGVGTLLKDIAVDFIKHPIEVGAAAIVAAIVGRSLLSKAGGLLGIGGGAAGGGAAGAAAGGVPLGLVLGGAAMAAGGAYAMAKGGQVATQNMWDILRGKGGTAMNVAKGTMAYNIFNPMGMAMAATAWGGAKAVGGIRSLFGGGGGGKDDTQAASLLQEANRYLAQIAGREGSINQHVTINGAPQPELVAQQVIDQARAQGMAATMG